MLASSSSLAAWLGEEEQTRFPFWTVVQSTAAVLSSPSSTSVSLLLDFTRSHKGKQSHPRTRFPK